MHQTLALADYPRRDILRARKQCNSVVSSIKTPIPALAQETVITILVPVYNESIERLKKQIASFSKQTLDKSFYEIIFIVNNPPLKKSSPEVLKANASILAFLNKAKDDQKISVIDRSSKGRELKAGNVGEARNYGLHVVTKRYLDQNRDGLIIQTDADSFPSNKKYLDTVWKDVTKNNAYGAAGGLKFVLDIDSKNKNHKAFFKKHISTFRNYARWNFLLSSLNKKSPELKFHPTIFSGAHMISRAVAAICAGGIKPINKGEDTFFGMALNDYAKKIHGVVLPRRDEWIMVTSFRESYRGGTSFGPIFANIKDHNGKPLVRASDTPYYPLFLKKELVQLRKTLLPKPKPPAIFLGQNIAISKEEYREIVNIQDKLKRSPRVNPLTIYEEIRHADRSVVLHKFFNRFYRMKYPLVPLEKRDLKQLEKRINKDPLRKAYVDNAVKYYGTFHLK